MFLLDGKTSKRASRLSSFVFFSWLNDPLNTLRASLPISLFILPEPWTPPLSRLLYIHAYVSRPESANLHKSKGGRTRSNPNRCYSIQANPNNLIQPKSIHTAFTTTAPSRSATRAVSPSRPCGDARSRNTASRRSGAGRRPSTKCPSWDRPRAARAHCGVDVIVGVLFSWEPKLYACLKATKLGVRGAQGPSQGSRPSEKMKKTRARSKLRCVAH